MNSGPGSRGPGYWSEFPDTYRAEQVEAIAKWIAVGDSGVVIGGSGAGKSNLVGFVTSRPEVVCEHLPGGPHDYVFVHMDVNSLPDVNTPFFYRSMLLALQNAATQIDPGFAEQIRQTMTNVIGPEDTLGLQFALQQAHDVLVSGAGRHVVWLIDRFDEACARLEPTTLNSLRNIRDNHLLKGRLSYVVFTRYPLARIRHPRDYDEFHEIMVPNTCWVGPMVKRDARWMASQMADRHLVTFGEEAVDLLYELSGGLPAFMKAACTSLATGLLLPGESAYIWLDRILDQQSVLRNCQEMWDDLKPEEQSTLTAIAAGADEAQLDATALTYLEESRLLSPIPASSDSKVVLRVFSPVFELFVLRQQMLIASGIALDPTTGALMVNDRALRTKLTPQENRLMAYLVEHRGDVCGKDALIAHVWSDENLANGEQNERLSQTIEQLRQKIEGDMEKGTLIKEVDGKGYRFQDPSKVAQVHIAVDEEKFQDQVQKIVETDFFQNLKQQAREMRKARAGAG